MCDYGKTGKVKRANKVKAKVNQTANWLKSAAILLPLAALAACGSASRDAPPGPGPGFGPGVGYPVNAATALSLTDGTPPEEMTEGDIRQAIRQRTSPESADVLLATQTIVDGGTDLNTDCSARSNPRECEIIGVTSAAVAPFAASLNFVLSLNQNQPILGNYPTFGFSAQPVMEKHGVTLFQSISRGRRGGITESYITYAGWITDNPSGSVFGFRALHLQENPRTEENPQTAVLGTGFSAGKESTANPRGIGSATWQGIMVGGMRNGNDFIQGDVRLDIDDLRAPNVDVAFTNIKNLNNGADIAVMEWTNIALSNGKFISSANGNVTLEGTFYGDNHEEVGGIFDRDQFVGGFGASRLPTSGPGDPSGSDYPVNAATALTRAGGVALEEPLTAAQIDAALRQRAAPGAADTLLSTDVDISINGTGNSANLTTNCTGRNCTARHILPGESDLQWSLDDPLLGNFPGYAFNAQTIMQKNAVTLAQSVSSGRPEPGLTDTRLAYVGWLEQSAFYFGATRSYTNDGTVVLNTGSSFGAASGNQPRGLGSAVWSGVMLGGLVDTTSIVQGDAMITLDLESINVDVNFTEITNLNTGANIAAMSWNNVRVASTGRFASNLGSLQGSFYGADYSEVGGTFDRNNIVGAFGARLTDNADGSFYAIVNAAHARNIAGGSAITLADIAATLAARADSADILLASDVVVTNATGATSRHTATCANEECRATGSNFRVDFSLRELLDFYRTENPATQPIMTRNGINTVQTAHFDDSQNTTRLAYGAWLDDSAFAVQITRHATGAIERAGLSLGEASASNPGGTGSAIWNGLMLASAIGSTAMVQGDATIDVDDLANPDVDVIFRNLVNLNGPTGLPPYNTNGIPLTISWDNLPLTDGQFAHGEDDDPTRIRGSFYGAVHDEVGGTFDYESNNLALTGAFGARRGDMDLGSADYPVHAASARRIAAGSVPPELTSADISNAFGQRIAPADTILASNIIANGSNQSAADCTTATCRIVANARTLSLDDPFLGNLPGYNFSAQAVMLKGPITLAQSVSRGTTQNRTETHISYGGWLDQSAFGIRRTRLQTSDQTAGLSIGMASRSNPAGAGAAVWEGVMVGSMVNNRNVVQGDAMLTMNLNAVTVDVKFEKIRNLNTGAEIPNMDWTNIAVTNGAFTTNSGNLTGRFYTADYSEVGGTFDNNQIVGAFGAKRLQDGHENNLEGALYAVVNAAHARTVINAAAPNVRAANIAATIAERAINATTLLVSDVVSEIPATATLNTYTTNCTGRECSARDNEFQIVFSPDDTLGNLRGYDFNTQAVMLQNGIDTIQAASLGTPRSTIPETRLTYGAWLEDSAFAVRITRYGQKNTRGSNTIERAGLSFGTASGGNPGGIGSATWTGLMVGSATTGTDIVQGDAHIDVDDLSNPDVDVAFRNIFNLNGPTAVPPYNVNGVPLTISWDNLPVTGGQFSRGNQNDSIRIRGSFYGDNQREVGGVFNYNSANFDLVGAFGGRRGAAVDPSSPSGTDYPVHAAAARSLVGGDRPPILGSSGVDAAVRQRTNTADTLLASNITANGTSQLTADCSTATCTIVANARALSLNNPLLGNFPEYSFSAQPVMVKNAVTLAQAVSRGANPSGAAESHITYTGWLDQSIFGIRRTRLQNNDQTAGFSIGNDSASNPGGTGTAVWSGVMTGSQGSNANVVQGEAMLTLDLDAVNVDITFDQIKNLNTGDDVARMTWAGLALANGKFNSANNDLRGSFYATDYSEVGGTFERSNIVGAFGARRLADGVDGALYAVVNAQHARAIIGATAATTSANIATTIGNRAARADTLLASDVVAETSATTVTHLTNCTGRTCAASSDNFRAEFSLNDMLLGNLQGYDFNTQTVMLHNGINTVQAASVGTPRTRIPETRLTYGAWLDNSAFAVRITRYGESGAAGSAIERAGLSFGQASVGSPGGTGSAVWTGVMLGSAINSTAMVQGDAHIDVDDLGNPDVDVAFRNIFNLNGPAEVPPYNINGIPLTISWDNLQVTDGAFAHANSDGTIRLRGSFYGTNHEEVGGTFNYNTSNFGFVGAFGGQRRAVVDPSDPSGTDYPVHAASSLNLVGGDAPPRLSPSAIAAAVGQRAASADTLLASNITANGSNQLTADCTAAACTIVSNTRALSLDDPLLGNFANYDFSAQAVMLKNTVTLFQAVSRAPGESHITYGGWLDQSLFGIRTTRLQNGAATATAGWSVGNDSASNPGGTGAAVWRGVMTGSQTDGSNVVQGDATLTLDLDAVEVDVAFTDIKNLNTGADVAAMSWQDLSVTNGKFNSANSDLRGSFYAADYSEVGGTFERSNIVGAFGASRLADGIDGALYAVVNAHHARTVINAAAATIGDNNIATEIGNRAASANILLLSDVVAETVSTGATTTHATECTGRSCAARSDDFRAEFSLDRVLLGNFQGYNFNTQAVMLQNTINTVQAASVGTPGSTIPETHLTYGGWLDDSTFAVRITRYRQSDAPASTAIERAGMSFGVPSDSNPGGTGSASWTGLMVGSATSGSAIVQGDAHIDVDDLGNPDVDVAFRNIFNLNGPTGVPPYNVNGVPLTISWDNLQVTDGIFAHANEDGNIRIHGSFYGANHDEVGGAFNYDTERFGLVGAFGGKRGIAGPSDPSGTDYPVHAASARTFTGGTTPPRLGASGVDDAIRQRIAPGVADTLLSSAIAVESGSDLTSNCTGRDCTATGTLAGQNVTRSLSLDDPLFGNAPGYSFSAQPVMLRNGVTLAQAVSRGTTQSGTREIYITYGGWLDASVFGVRMLRVQPQGSQNTSILRSGWSAGDDSGSNPGGAGLAAWSGVMVGGQRSGGNMVQGDATLTLDLNAAQIDVNFANIKNLNTGADIAAMNWSNVAVTGGKFTSSVGALQGTFYGDEYDEVGGTFDRSNIVGAFGARRLTRGADVPIGTLYPIINVDRARSIASGTIVSPTLSAADITTGIQNRAAAANRLFASDVAATDSNAGQDRHETVCAGRECAAKSAAFRVEFSLDEPLLGNRPGYSFNAAAVMQKNDITTLQAASSAISQARIPKDQLTYGGWLDNSAFAVQTIRYRNSDPQGTDAIERAGLSFGLISGSNPSGIGKAVWEGVMVGSRKDNTDIVQGDARVEIDDLSKPEVDVALDNIFDLNGTAGAPAYAINGEPVSISWDKLTLTDGTFADDNIDTTGNLRIHIRGSFYAADYSEVGGVFDYTTDDLGLVGAFGAKRATTSGLSGQLYPVNAVSARIIAGGSAAPSLTATDISTEIARRAAPPDPATPATSADTLLASTLAVSGGADLTNNCTGRSCTATGTVAGDSNFSLTLSLDDPLLGNLTGYDFNAQSVMTKNGVVITQAVSRGSPQTGETDTRLTYAGWLDESAFGVQIIRLQDSQSTAVLGAGFSFGNDSGGNPAGTGSATWSGIMVGSPKNNQNIIQGDASIDIDNLANPNVDVQFANIKNLNTGADVAAMSWDDIAISNGTFTSSTGGTIRGTFYGDEYQEVGGIFDRSSIVGGFGARRMVTVLDYPVNADSARSFAGGSAATITFEQIDAAVRQTTRSADRLLATNADIAGGSSLTTNCSGATCTASGTLPGNPSFSISLSTDNPPLANLPGAVFNAQPVMQKNGVTLAQTINRVTTANTTTTHVTYGGWLQGSAFGTQTIRQGNAILRMGLSTGNDTGRNPEGAGTAVWNGVMTGSVKTNGNIAQGDAMLTLDMNASNVDIDFTNIKNLNTNADINTISWDNITVSNGGFTSSVGALQGSFYGDQYEEAGGIFDQNGIVGAFGARRITSGSGIAAFYPITDAAKARTIAGGTTVSPTITASNIPTTFAARITAADKLLASDVFATSATGANDRHTTNCAGETCIATNENFQDFRLELSLDDPLLGNRTNYTFNAQPVMTKNTINTIQAASTGTPASTIPETYLTYGAWLDDSAFAVQTIRYQQSDPAGNDAIERFGMSFGNDSGSKPGGSGSATWNGLMVGITQTGTDIVQGDASVDIDDLGAEIPLVDVVFRNIFNLNGSPDSAPYNIDGEPLTISWDDIPLTVTGTDNAGNPTFDGTFATQSDEEDDPGFSDYGSVQGTFYGTTHDEVGGVFDHTPSGITGAFGAQK